MPQEVAIARMTLHTHPTSRHLNNLTGDKRRQLDILLGERVGRVVCLLFPHKLAVLEQDLQAQWVQVQVLSVDDLVVVEARVAVLCNYLLFYRVLLLQRSLLIKRLQVDECIRNFTF